MKTTIEARDHQLILSVLEERLDASNSAELRDAILGHLDAEGCQLVLDLSAVSFIDSSGLGALLSGFKAANLRSGRLVLAGLQPRVQSMFELTRLHRVFEIFPSTQAALSSA